MCSPTDLGVMVLYHDNDPSQEQPDNGQVLSRGKRQEIAAFAMAFAMAQCSKGMSRDKGRGLRPRSIPPLPVYPDTSVPESEITAAFNRLRALAARWKYGVPVISPYDESAFLCRVPGLQVFAELECRPSICIQAGGLGCCHDLGPSQWTSSMEHQA